MNDGIVDMTAEEKALLTECAMRLFIAGGVDVFASGHQLLREAEACFGAAAMFMLARHRTTEHCPDRETQ